MTRKLLRHGCKFHENQSRECCEGHGIIGIHDCAVKPCDTFKANCTLRHGLGHLDLVNRWPQDSEVLLL